MRQYLSHVAIVVDDYDEAIQFYLRLGFTVLEDTMLSETKRWVLIAPPGYQPNNCSILLAKASTEEQLSRVGNQTGGRVFLFLNTDDFWRDYHRFLGIGIVFVRTPSVESYGTVAVFKDVYGNLWDLIQPTEY